MVTQNALGQGQMQLDLFVMIFMLAVVTLKNLTSLHPVAHKDDRTCVVFDQIASTGFKRAPTSDQVVVLN